MSQRKKAAKKPRPYHKGNVSRDMMKAASHILQTERVEDISVRRLTREVGVTPANFYNYFPSLDALLLTLAADAFDEVSANFSRIMTKDKNRNAALLQLSVQFVEFAMANKQLFRIMFGQLPSSMEHARFRQASEACFDEVILAVYGQQPAAGSVDIKDKHRKAKLAYAVFALVYGLARNIIEDQFEFATGSRAEIRQFVEDVMGTLLDATVPKKENA